jgi:hypothetical protein
VRALVILGRLAVLVGAVVVVFWLSDVVGGSLGKLVTFWGGGLHWSLYRKWL